MTHPLDAFFNPRSIAVIGASNTPGKIGAAPLSFLLKFGFDGTIVPINPVQAQVQGKQAWPTLEKAVKGLGHGIDLAIVAVPAALTLQTLHDAARAGVRNLVLFSSGFGETGADGARAQHELAEQARQLGVRILGPNCLGFINLARHVYATFSPMVNVGLTRRGPIAMVSQSGAFGVFAYSMARERGVGLSHWITTGNEVDVSLADCIEWLAQDDATRIIMCYIEGVRDGARLKQALNAARAAGKPVVAVKVGRSELGAQAAASHTASLAGDDLAYEALFRQYGVWRAHSIDEFFEVAHALAVAPVPQRAGLGVLTASGGVGVLLADEAHARGVELPAMPLAAQQKILEMVPFGAPRNPVDVTGQVTAQPDLVERAARLMLTEGSYGSVVVFLAAAGLAPKAWDPLFEQARNLRRDFPQVVLAYSCLITRERREQLEALGCLCFEEPTHAVRVMAALEFFRCARDRTAAPQASVEPIAQPTLPMNEAQALAWLSAQGLSVMKHAVAQTPEQAVEHAQALGYPVALKVLSADILHKSDVGGVALGLSDADQVRRAFDAVMSSSRKHAPQAHIAGALIAPMASGGVECILGVRHDPALGALVLLGIGGVDVELLRDISVRVAPLDQAEAQAMVDELKLAPLLRGHRGRPLADEAALVASLVCLSRIGAACDDWMDSIEINPMRVLAQGAGVVALDAVVTARVKEDACDSAPNRTSISAPNQSS